MTNTQFGTSELRSLLARSQAGDASARERLALSVYHRLELLTRQMLRRYPQVRLRNQTGDVLNSAMIRFLRALTDTQVRDTQHFYALATQQIRRELIDLARRTQGLTNRTAELNPLETTPADPAPGPSDLDSWCAFHEAVSELPDDLRAVFEPVFYHDLAQVDLAEQMGVHPKTIQRRYRTACLQIYERLGGRVPQG